MGLAICIVLLHRVPCSDMVKFRSWQYLNTPCRQIKHCFIHFRKSESVSIKSPHLFLIFPKTGAQEPILLRKVITANNPDIQNNKYISFVWENLETRRRVIPNLEREKGKKNNLKETLEDSCNITKVSIRSLPHFN